MTTMTDEQSGKIPTFDLADRLRKSLREADISVQEMAVFMGLSRQTIGNWINGHTTPPIHALRLWAMRCGVSFDWLRGDVNAKPAAEVGPGDGLGGKTTASGEATQGDRLGHSGRPAKPVGYRVQPNLVMLAQAA